jgi:hypothetical protein
MDANTTISHNLDGGDFYGTSRSVTAMPVHRRAWPTCRRCGSTLSGHNHKGTVLRRFKGAVYVAQAFRCRCGTRRFIRQGVAA